MREHLQSMHRQSGVMPALLAEAASLPPALAPLWGDFLALHNTRGSNGFGPSRISFADLDAFQRVSGAVLEPWQIEAVRRADSAYLSHYAATHKPRARK